MAVLRKRLQKQDLTNIDTFIIDNKTESIYFNVVSLEEIISGGKTTFQILGSKYLVPDAEIKIELLDSNGNPVFIEAIKYLGDKPSRHISVEVYGNTPAGEGKLTILGSAETLDDGTEIPDEWKNLYNVKWEKNVFIDPQEKNVDNIIFQGESVGFGKLDRYRLPSLEISEQIRGVVIPSGSGGSTETGFVTKSLFTGGNYQANSSPFDRFIDINDLSGETKEGFPFDSPDYEYQNSLNSYSSKPDIISDDEIASGLGNNFDDELYESFHGAPPIMRPFPEEDDFPIVREDDVVVAQAIPDPNFTGKGTLIKRTSGDAFRSEFAGGIFRAEPNVNLQQVKNIAGQDFVSSSFTASIVAVHSPDLIEIDRPFTIQSNRTKDKGKKFKVPHQATSFKIDFEPAGQTQNSGSGESTTIFRSFAEITIKNMKTFSGDIHRVKTYTRGYSNSSPFNLISDRLVEAADVLNDRSSPTLSQKIGVFKNQNQLDKYWVLKRRTLGPKVPSISTSGSISFGDRTEPAMMNGVHISGSNGGADETIVFETKLSNLKVRPDVDYELKLRPVLKVGQKDVLQPDGSVEQKAKAKVRFYISGSKINQNNPSIKLGNAVNDFGDPIKVTKTTDENYGNVITLEQGDSDDTVGKLLDFSIVKIPFRPSFNRDVVVNDDTKLQIEVESGELFLGRVELIPATETNFSPDEFTFVAPMPKLRTKPDIFDFRIEFLNRDGKKSDYIALKDQVQFEGENEVIQGSNNLLTGSLFVGNTIGQGVEIGGTNSAFIRSVGYHGFSSASMKANGTGSGFLIFSGSVLPNLSSSDNYRGIGLELHDGDDSFLQYRTEVGASSGSLFKVQSKDFFFGKSGSNGAFISGSNGNLEMSSSQFHLDTEGNISASNLHIEGGTITGSLVIGDSVTVNAATANQIRVPVGGPPFKAEILPNGFARFSTGSIASFNIDSNAFFTTGSNSFYISGSAVGIPKQGGRQNNFISASKFQVSALGDLTASNVLIDGGTITGDVDVQGTFSADEIRTPAVGDAKSEITTAGYARFVSASIGDFAVNTSQIKSFGEALILSSSGAISGSQVFFTGGKIGGWELGSDRISSNNLIISSSGAIQSANYIANFRGFNLSTFGNGFLEVEEAKIRGTLRTTVFEKETVNAVGGQLWVANSTTISGSQVGVGKSTTSMSVENVSGFSAGEVALVKKVTQTGFSSEYIRINSSSRTFPDNDENLSGFLFVSRSISRLSSSINTTTSHGLGALSSSVSELPGTGSSYTDGQVIVSTGKINTGFIRLNANSNDTFTPYMDIVERTGSAVFDTELKVRLGDLSGLKGKINGASVSGFGLATDNVFLTGSFFVGGLNEHISFQTGSFEAKLNKLNLDTTGLKIQGEGSGASNKILLGDATAIANGDGVYIDGSGKFRAGGASSNFVKFNGSALEVNGSVTITGGGAQTVFNTIGANTSSLFTSASQAKLSASFAASGSQAFATANTSSSLAGFKLPLQTQVELTSAGMNLKNQANNKTLASYGVVTEFFKDGSTSNKAILGSTGLSIVQGGVTQSRFGTDVIVGKDATDKSALRITDAGALSIGKKSATPNFEVAANGNVTMTGAITITGGGVQDVFDKIGADTGSLSGSIGTKINPFERQVALDIGGMSLKKQDGTILAKYGVVAELFQNGDTDEKAILGSSGLAIVQGGVTQSRFGEDVIVGKNATNKTALRITDAGALSIGTSNTTNFSVDTSGNVTTTGAITITAGALKGITTSSLATSTSSLSSSIGAKINPYETQVDLSTSGMSLKNSLGGIISTFGKTAKFFGSASLTASYGEVEKDGLLIVSGGVTSSFFGTDVIVGKNATNKTALRITDAGALSIGTSNTTNFSVDTSGNVTTTGAITITAGALKGITTSSLAASTASLFTSASQAKLSASFAASGSQAFATANISSSQAGFKLPLQTQVQLTSAGMNLKNQANNKTLASYGAVTELFKDGSADNKAILGGDGLVVVKGGVTSSIFGDSVELRSATIASKTTASLDADGFTIVKGGVTVGEFGSSISLPIGNISIGSSGGTNQNIQIASNAFKVRRGTNDIVTIEQQSIDTPVSDGRFTEPATRTVLVAPTASFDHLNVSTLTPNVQYFQEINNISTAGAIANTQRFQYVERATNSGDDPNENLAGNFRVNYSGSLKDTVQNSSAPTNQSPFRFEATYQSLVNNGMRLGELDGGIVDIRADLTGSFKNKLGAALMITVDDNSAAVASPFNDGYSFIHAKGSSNNGSTTDKFQVSSSGDVLAAGNITAFGTAFASVSDRSWKKDIETFSGSLEKLTKLRPRKFKWKKDNKEDYGFIAQEVETILPQIVKSSGFSNAGKETGDGKKHKTIDYAKLTPYLVDTIQELIKRIEKLERENKILRVD